LPNFALNVSPGKFRIIEYLGFLRRKAQPMRRSVVAVLCFISLFAIPAQGQSPTVAPLRVTAGTVLKFHLQARLNPTGGDALDALPKGTILQVRMLDAIDSATNPDATEFHGTLAAPLVSRGQVIVRTEAEVRGLLVLLRSRSHPDGFRYELLMTSLTDHGKSYNLTASLNPSFVDPGTQAESDSKTSTK
jgi:hypothetical protein